LGGNCCWSAFGEAKGVGATDPGGGIGMGTNMVDRFMVAGGYGVVLATFCAT